MANVLLMSAQYVKDYTIIDQNVDEKYIKMGIEEAQKLYIRDFLGTGLYDEIISQVTSGSVSTLNTILLQEYIQPALKWWCLVEAAPFMTFKVTNKNIVRKNSDNSSSIDYNELDKFLNEVTNKAQFHSNRLIRYLCENSNDYPLYLNPGNGIDTIFPRNTATDCGIYLGTRKTYTSYEERFERKRFY